MSETTNLKLKKHDEPLNENTNQFNVKDYLNGNWDKIEDFAEQVNDKVIEIEDSIDLVKQRTEQAVEDINTDIENIKEEQTEQNTNIQKNAADILNLDTNKASKTELQEATIALQSELLATRKDYEAGTLEGQAEGESLYLADSSDARFREFGIGGNDKQATRSEKNKLDLSKISQKTLNGVTCTYNAEEKSVTLNGTCTKDNTGFAIDNSGLAIETLVKDKTTLTAYYVSGECSGTGTTSVQAHATGFVSNIPISDLSDLKSLKIRTATYASTNYPNAELYTVNIRANEGAVLDNFTFKLMLTEDVDTEYEDFGAMPSLEFPSEVEAVGQDVNIFDSSIFEDIEQNGVKIKRNSDGTLTLNGTYTGMSSWNYSFYLPAPIANVKEQLYLSMQKLKGDCTGQIRFIVWEANYDNRWISFENNQYTNLLEGSTYAKASISIFSGATFDNLTIGLKISNKKDAIYSPYNHGSANTVVENKNKLDFSKWNNATASHGTIEQVENGIKLTATANDCYTNTFAYKFQGTLNRDKIECYGFIAKPNTKYTFSCKVNNIAISKRISMFFSDKDYNIISYVTSATSVLTATTPENCKYITIRVGVTNTGDSLTFTDLQVEEGDAADYTAHEEQTLTMPIQKEMLEGDYIDLDNEEEVHTWGKLELTGNETGWFKSSTTMTNAYGIKNEKIGLPVLTENTSKCTHFKYADGVTATSTSKYISQLENLYLSFPLDIAKTLEEFKSLMQEQVDAETPVTIYYKLETPTKLPFTEAQKAVAKQIRQTLHSYKGGTHVYCTDEISPIFNVKYTIDQKAYIQAEIEKIAKGVINNV